LKVLTDCKQSTQTARFQTGFVLGSPAGTGPGGRGAPPAADKRRARRSNRVQ
jgi:hypothetical protein